MRTLLSLQSPLAVSCLLLAGSALPTLAAAQTVQTDDYIYIGIEAEDHTNKDDRWVTTTPTTPATEADPDPNHSDQAGGSTYLELLPDNRVTHGDEMGPGTFWAYGGFGPQADYSVDFPEPGRYHVHIRAYSTGTEDNGIHVGLNGNWPNSGHRMQFCSSNKRAWWWSSAQRGAGGHDCGKEKTIWLDIPTAGVHIVNIGAREDGFEIDRLALIKDVSGSTRICSPSGLTDVNCHNGSIEEPDEFVDLKIDLSVTTDDTDPEAAPTKYADIDLGSQITLTAEVANRDTFDAANDVVFSLSPMAGDWDVLTMDDRCVENNGVYDCELGKVFPAGHNTHKTLIFTLESKQSGNADIETSVTTSDVDDDPNNDSNSAKITVLAETDLSVSLGSDSSELVTGESVALAFDIETLGEFDGQDVALSLEVPDGLAVVAGSLPDECDGTNEVVCEFDAIDKSNVKSFSIELMSELAGSYTLNTLLTASNDTNVSNNQNSVSISVEDLVLAVVEPTEPEDNNAGEGGESGSGANDNGENAGSNDIPTVTTSDAEEQADIDADSGSMTYWFVLAMMLLYSARLYRWDQRKMVAIRQ